MLFNVYWSEYVPKVPFPHLLWYALKCRFFCMIPYDTSVSEEIGLTYI